jgi:hypothetical protein
MRRRQVVSLLLISNINGVVYRSCARSNLHCYKIWKLTKNAPCFVKNLNVSKLLRSLMPSSFSVRFLFHKFLSCFHSLLAWIATLEMLLLLIWRHIEYYAEPRHMNMPPNKTTVANAMRLLVISEPEVFQADVGQKIAPSLQKLEVLDLVCFFDSAAFFPLILHLFHRMANPLVVIGRITKAILRLCVAV